MRSTCPARRDVDKVVAGYDVADYKRVEDDGSFTVALEADASELASLRAAGFKIGRTIEDAKHRAQVNAEREETAALEALAGDLAENGVPRGGIKLEGKAVVPTPGETVIQRANTFTNYAGRFLYVEAHNKATVVVNNVPTGPAQALSWAGEDGVYSAATNMAIFEDSDPTPDVYMYHRQLIRLPAGANPKTVRVASASGAVDTFKVTEWLGTQLPAERRGLPEGLLQPLPGPDREPRPARHAGRRVQEPGHPGQPAAPDERLPAQVAGDHVRYGRDRLGSARRARRAADRHHG